ncbi:MAG: hypothetical protein K0V04_46565 [Deltaproteobacteria bacterium]|nr:hypothetical protein [Deltaproteobacteria bacterium]
MTACGAEPTKPTASGETDDSGTSSTPATTNSATTSAGADGSSTVATGSGVTGDDTTSGAADSSGGSDTGPPVEPPAFPDLEIGPYPSALTMAIDSMESGAAALDTSTTYDHSAAQGYLLQAIGELLWAARDHQLDRRDALVAAALEEIEQLAAADDQIVGGGPGFGLTDAWDAFGDGSTNPAFTGYTWQSGMVALGVAKVARVLEYIGHPQAAATRDYATALVERWDLHYTSVTDGGYWWYSTTASDAIAVHNTSVLVAMASQIVADSGGDPTLAVRPPASADLLWARMSGNPSTGYTWNYADDGYPVELRHAEDVSHALVTLQLMREARGWDWWSDSQMQGVAQTLLSTIWTGNPARLNGYVDGSDGGNNEWSWTRAAVIGYAAHGNAPGDDPEVFDAARSILFSSYLSRFERPLRGGTVDSARTLALALLLARRPDAFAAGSEWTMVAGRGDDAIPEVAGGVRFYTVDWAAPSEHAAGLQLPARVATTANANLLVDLEASDAGRVIVSLTYSSAVAGTVAQWDGQQYISLAPLPATADDQGTVRWVRTTFELDPTRYFDYQGGVPGTNVLLQTSASGVAVHRIEATRL